jgi:hypothetical protein
MFLHHARLPACTQVFFLAYIFKHILKKYCKTHLAMLCFGDMKLRFPETRLHFPETKLRVLAMKIHVKKARIWVDWDRYMPID